jgi:hypothetical protein
MGNYRVFISYSHEDRQMVEKVVQVLKQNGLTVLWDENFAFGHGFHEQIKNFISHAHVFMPIITRTSSQRGWVHQEIGYAMALNVPVLPVTKDQLPGEMLQQLHAVSLSDDLVFLYPALLVSGVPLSLPAPRLLYSSPGWLKVGPVHKGAA